MRLADEVHAEIQSFVSGLIDEHELEGWLDCASAEIHAQGEPDLRTLTDRAYSLLAEVGYGDRTVEDARGELAKLVVTSDHIDPALSRAETTFAHGATDWSMRDEARRPS